MKIRLCNLILLLLSIPLMGVSSEEAFGCSCGGGGSEPAVTTEIPGGGGISESANYTLDRSQIGISWEATTSANEGYRVSATLGHYISHGRTLSDQYLIHHPMSRDVVLTEPGE